MSATFRLPVAPRHSRMLRESAFIGAIVMAEIVLALATVEKRFEPLLGLLALAILGAVVLRWPFVGVTGLIVLVASALPAKLVLVPVGPLQLRGYEVVLIALLGVAVVAPRRRTWGGPAGVAIGIFLVLLALSAMASVLAGRTTFQTAFDWGRDFGFLTLFYVVIRLFPDRTSIERLLVLAVVVAALTGVVSLLLATTHNLPAFLQASGQGFAEEQQGITGSLNRVRLPGTALAYALLWLAVLRMIGARGLVRLGWALAIAGMVLGIALSFNRNMWIGTFVGLAGLLLVGGVRLRRSFAFGGGIAALVVAGALLGGVGVSKQSPVAPIIQRGTTLFRPDAVAHESSLTDRGHETALAWKAIQKRPLQGVGIGAPFGMFYSERQPNGTYKPTVQLFLHNQYLYLLLVAGLPGLLAFLWFAVNILRRGVWLRGDPAMLALTIGFAEILLSAFVMIALSTADLLTAVSLIAGVITAVAASASTTGAAAVPAVPVARARRQLGRVLKE